MYVCVFVVVVVCVYGGRGSRFLLQICCPNMVCASHVIGPQGRELSTVVVIEYLSEVHSFLPSTNLV